MSRPAGTASYAALLRLPGALPAFAAAALLRLSYAAVVLSLLLVVQEATGSFAIAGAAVGAYALPSLLAPYKSRLVDRIGARRALTFLGIGYGGVLAGVAGCAAAGIAGGLPYLLLSALAGVVSPPAGPVMRGIWARLTPDAADRNRAYSLDAVVDEGLFALGPLLVGVVVAIAGAVAALLLTAALALVGAGALGLSTPARATAVAGAVPSRRRLLGPLLLPGVRWIVLAMLAVGLGLAPLEIAVVARASQAGHPAAAGYLLAVLSVGSAAGGLLWGRLRRTPPTSKQLLALIGMLGAGTAAAGLVPSLAALAVVLTLTGGAVAPAFVVAYVLADQLVDDSVRTEANTWIVTAANVGGAAGAAAAGLMVEHISARASFTAGGLLLIAALPLLATSLRRTQRDSSAIPTPELE